MKTFYKVFSFCILALSNSLIFSKPPLAHHTHLSKEQRVKLDNLSKDFFERLFKSSDEKVAVDVIEFLLATGLQTPEQLRAIINDLKYQSSLATAAFSIGQLFSGNESESVKASREYALSNLQRLLNLEYIITRFEISQ